MHWTDEIPRSRLKSAFLVCRVLYILNPPRSLFLVLMVFFPRDRERDGEWVRQEGAGACLSKHNYV